MAATRCLKLWALNACEKVEGRVATVLGVRKRANFDRKRAAEGAMPRSPVGWMNGFSGLKHT